MPSKRVPDDFMQRFAGIPVPTYDRDRAKLVAFYKRAFREIAKEYTQAAKGGGLTQERAASLLRQVEFILRRLDKQTAEWCSETLRAAFVDGQSYTILALGEAASLAEAASVAEFSMLATQTVDALVADTYSDLLVATRFMEKRVKQVVRETVAETMQLRTVQQFGRNSMAAEIRAKLTKKFLEEQMRTGGWVGIVDRKGRRWNLTTYSDMVVRTKLNQAWVEGVKVETKSRDDGEGRPVDLATISRHGATDACSHFEGLVISIHGLTPGYLTYDELRASQLIFHPNCGHKLQPLRTFDLLNDDQKALHKAKYAEARKALAAGRR